jgi:DNA-3-methyladenine glycosylase II
MRHSSFFLGMRERCRVMKTYMHNDQHLSSPASQGHFFLPSAQAVSRFADLSSQTLLHPDYFDEQGCWYRLLIMEETPCAIKVSPSGMVFWASLNPLEAGSVQRSIAQLFFSLPLPQDALLPLPQELGARFLQQMPLTHIASASLGEAVMKAVIRQVISALHAKKLLHRFVMRHGPSLEYEGTRYYGFPSLKAIASLSPEVLQADGLGYKSRLLPRIALDLLERQVEEQFPSLSPEAAVEALQQVKGIGRWTARVAVCDVTADWSVYPFEDLAVRSWAVRLWPEYAWPKNEQNFFVAWKEINGSSAGIVTFYLLAQPALTAQSEQLRKQLALL